MRYKRLRYFVDNAVTFDGTRLGFGNKRSTTSPNVHQAVVAVTAEMEPTSVAFKASVERCTARPDLCVTCHSTGSEEAALYFLLFSFFCLLLIWTPSSSNKLCYEICPSEKRKRKKSHVIRRLYFGIWQRVTDLETSWTLKDKTPIFIFLLILLFHTTIVFVAFCVRLWICS